METVQVKATMRTTRGKGGARELRRKGMVPGILYGPSENLAIAVERMGFDRLLRAVSAGNAVLQVQLEGHEREDIKAILKEVQRHPVNEAPVHFDLEHIRLDQRVKMHVPVRIVGAAPGVKAGGILEHLQRDLEVEGIAAIIPSTIDVDVTALERNESIHVRDLTNLPEGLHVANSPDQVIVSIVNPVTEVEPAPAEAAPPPPAAS